MSHLQCDTNEAIRVILSINEKIDEEILDLLSKDSSKNVRFAVSKHKNVSIKTLERLSKDSSFSISQVAKLRCDKRLIMSKDEEYEWLQK